MCWPFLFAESNRLRINRCIVFGYNFKSLMAMISYNKDLPNEYPHILLLCVIFYYIFLFSDQPTLNNWPALGQVL